MPKRKPGNAKGKARPRRKSPAPPVDESLRHKRRQQRSATRPPEATPREPLLSAAALSVNQRKFLNAYALHGNITKAAELAGLTRQSHYKWLPDPHYAAAFEEASEVAIDLLVNEARRRAMGGSDTLLIFLLKGLRPKTFRDNHHLTLKGKLEHDAV